GYRYYQPWAGRWLSADPAGTVDGLNLFRMVRNNPVSLRDENGLAPDEPYQINDERIEYERKVALNVLDIAIEKMQQKNLDKDTKEKIRAIFEGSSSRKKIKTSRFKNELLANFEHMRDKLATSPTVYDPKMNPKEAQAFIRNGQPMFFFTSSYFITSGYVENVVTLMHESSHVFGVQRNDAFQEIYTGTFGRHAQDYVYADRPGHMEDSASDYVKAAITSFQRFHNEIKDETYRNKVTEKSRLKLSRLKTALHNADHLAITALSLGGKNVDRLLAKHPSRSMQ
ncbi:RHS repeat-associated core domain-containing protein, partial [Cedecea neteri]